jgi:hypothetical protein
MVMAMTSVLLFGSMLAPAFAGDNGDDDDEEECGLLGLGCLLEGLLGD